MVIAHSLSAAAVLMLFAVAFQACGRRRLMALCVFGAALNLTVVTASVVLP